VRSARTVRPRRYIRWESREKEGPYGREKEGPFGREKEGPYGREKEGPYGVNQPAAGAANKKPRNTDKEQCLSGS
jgi:hypothetical protein